MKTIADSEDSGSNLGKLLLLLALAGLVSGSVSGGPSPSLADGSTSPGKAGLSVQNEVLGVSPGPASPSPNLGRRPFQALAPLGVPTVPESTAPGAPDLPASFRVRAFLPGSLGPELRVDVVSLGPGGLPIAGAGDPALFPGLPQPVLEGTTALVLKRQADDPRQEGYGLYLSEEVVAVADLRAAKDYVRVARENEQCTRCDRAAVGVGAGAREILSGERIKVRFPEPLRSTLVGIYGERRLAASELELSSVRWETSPSTRQEPALAPSTGFGQVPPGLLLHSGEMSRAAVDLAVKGRGLDFAFARTYRSQGVGSGPLGPGWDHAYRVRLRELPNRDVELYDGRGRRELFEYGWRSDTSTYGYQAPTGWFVSLVNEGDGWLLRETDGRLVHFDRWGRLTKIADAYKDGDDTGNEMRFVYDAASNLVRVIDDLGRLYRLRYDAKGRLIELEDFDGRKVVYGYGATGGQLERVTAPVVTAGLEAGVSERVTEYSYPAPTGLLAQRLTVRDDLVSETDARGETWLTVSTSDADGDGRTEEATTLTWGGDGLSVLYDFAARTATVTNRRGDEVVVSHDAAGHPVGYVDAEMKTWSWTYDAEGLATRATSATGRSAAYSYQTECAGGSLQDRPRRSRGDRTRIVVTPEPGNVLGTNGSSGQLVTCIAYDEHSHQPVRIVDARGTETLIERERGKMKKLREAVGTPEERQTTVDYDLAGRPVRIVEPLGRRTDLAYFESGDSEGYLRQTVVDPAGLALTTRYETDARGNVTAVIDPRGARHEQVWNEADWLVATTAAAGGTSEGSGSQPALGYETRWLHDAVGQVVEIERPYGLDGASATRETLTYGALGQLLSRQRETEPGGVVVSESFEYDPHQNLVTHTREAGQKVSYTYSPRDLLVARTLGSDTAAAVTESFDYDDDGRRTSRTDPHGAEWLELYDGYGRLGRVRDPLLRVATWSFDDGGLPLVAARRVTAEAAEPLAETHWTYDALGRPVVETGKLWSGAGYGAAQDVTTTTVYDALDGVTSSTDALGRITLFGYDAAHRLKEVTDPLGNRTVLTLDAAGNAVVTTSHETLPEGGMATVTTTAIYDALGRPVTASDGLGNTTTTTYDARDQARTVRDAEGNVTSYAYDGLDRLLRIDRPEGIAEIFAYDAAGRLTTYADALGHTTRYTYDPLDRLLTTTYPDSTVHTRSYQLDRLAAVTDANGTVVTHIYDAAGRLTARTAALGPGILGPTSETYAYDALDRLVQATSGSAPNAVTTSRTYDSLSRLLSETGPGGTVHYQRDAAGNAIELGYPSGLELARVPDALDRPELIGPKVGQAINPLATYTYRGPDLLATKTLANGLTGTWSYDGARRVVGVSFTDDVGEASFAETLGWDRRGLRTATQRPDLGDAGEIHALDPAGRLLLSAKKREAVARTTPNSAVDPAELAPDFRSSFAYDPAENLIQRQVTQAVPVPPQALPPDPSGRNRPASVGGKALVWDANGNLIQKGDLSFEYDFRNRLIRASHSGAELATYVYDAFNRLVEVRPAGSAPRVTVWSGWQEIEEYLGGQLWQRRTYGLGLDELVLLEADLDQDGSLETDYAPLYDAAGNLAVLTGAQGQPVAKYFYSPFGDTMAAHVDAGPSQVYQVLFKAGELWLEFSEEVLTAPFFEAVTSGEVYLEETAGGTRHALVASFPVGEGMQARQRVVLTPSTAPTAGVEVELVVASEAMRDLFDNAPSDPYSLTFPWPDAATAQQVLEDTAAPEVEQVYLKDSHLEIELSELVDPEAAAQAILIGGAPTSWELLPDGYTLCTTSPLPPGSHSVEITTAPLDISGQGLTTAFTTTAQVATTATGEQLYTKPPATQVEFAALGNLFSYHGRPLDVATGLVYFRNRYYDPELARFITADPLGYVDGPSQYIFAMNSPAVFGDPLGLLVGVPEAPAIAGSAATASLGVALDPSQSLWTRLQAANLVASFGPAALGEQGLLAFVNFPARVDDATDRASGDLVAGLFVETNSIARAKRLSRGGGTILLSFADGLALGLPGANAAESTVLRWVGRAKQRINPLRWFDDLGEAASAGFREGAVEGVEGLAPRFGARGAARLSGSGPVPGVIEVSNRFQSAGTLSRYNPRPNPDYGGQRVVEFVFDPTTSRFATGRILSGLGSPHQRLASAIQADEARVLGGTFSRGPDGQILTTEFSGHYGTRWTPDLARQFVAFLETQTGQTVVHTAWP